MLHLSTHLLEQVFQGLISNLTLLFILPKYREGNTDEHITCRPYFHRDTTHFLSPNNIAI
jgi:hypothetical protein